MLQYLNHLIFNFLSCLLVVSSTKTMAQTVLFNTQLNYTSTQVSNSISSIAIDENQVYFIANDYSLYCYDKITMALKYKKEVNSKSNSQVYFQNNLLITSTTEHQKHKTLILDKNTGEIIKKLNLSPLKTKPHFINDSLFISTIIDDEGGQLVGYDLKNDKILWNHFIGHGATKDFYIQNESIFANFDYDEWKTVTHDGEIFEEIFEEYETNKKMKLLHIFFMLSHDTIEITREYLSSFFSNPEHLKAKTNKNTTVLLNSKKLLVLADDLKVISNIELNKTLKELQDLENEYLEILKIETENVWFFYRNHVVNYNFKINKVVKMYDLTKWNAHQVILEDDNLWLVSKEDGQLYKIQLDLTKKELDEKKAKIEYYKCTEPDKARIEAEKVAEEKYKSKN